jgi:heme-degrading monooxygenase HmoA
MTVVSSLRTPAGAGEALVRALVPVLEQVLPSAQGRHGVRLLQHADDPDRFLGVSTWDTREAHRAHVQALGARLDDLLRASPIAYQYYDQLALYEDLSRHAGVAACVTLTAPSATAPAVRDFLEREGRRELIGRSGFVLRGVYQDQDVPERLFIMHGWDSEAELQAFIARTAPALEAQMTAWGADVTAFVGRVRADVDRYSPAR